MKKLIYLFTFAFCLSLSLPYNMAFFDTFKAFNYGTYSIIYDGKLSDNLYINKMQNGAYNMYDLKEDFDENKLPKSSDILCEYFTIDNSYDIHNYMQNNKLKLVFSEQVLGIKINYYFCPFLSKKLTANNKIFNIAIAERKTDFVIGYPTLMGSL